MDWLFRWQGVGETLKLHGLCGRRPRSRRREQAELELLTRVSVWPLVGPGSWATDLRVAISSGESEFHALTFCAARLIFTKSLVDGVGFSRVEGPTACSDFSAAMVYCESRRHWEAQTSSGQESLVTAGTGGRTGEGR